MPFSECICHNPNSFVSHGESKWLGHRRRRADEHPWVTSYNTSGRFSYFVASYGKSTSAEYLPIHHIVVHAVAARYASSEYSSWMLNLIDMFSMEQDNAKQRTHTLASATKRKQNSIQRSDCLNSIRGFYSYLTLISTIRSKCQFVYVMNLTHMASAWRAIHIPSFEFKFCSFSHYFIVVFLLLFATIKVSHFVNRQAAGDVLLLSLVCREPIHRRITERFFVQFLI